MASVAACRAAAWRAQQDLAELRRAVEQQAQVREALHRAVETRDGAGVRSALARDAASVNGLLGVEVRWAQRELALIAAEDSERQRREEAREALRTSTQAANPEALETAIEAARSAGLPADEVCAAELALLSVRTRERQRQAEDAATREVERAIQSEDVKVLMDTLTRLEGSLPPEKIAAAQRKIPGMQARTEMRRELATALKNKDDLQHLRHVVFAVKRSCLPPAEIAAAEQALKEAELERKKRLQAVAAANAATGTSPAVTPATAPPSAATAARVPPAAATAAAASAATTAPAATTAGVAVAREPQTQLEVAVKNGDRTLIQAAIAEFKASGRSAREISQLLARASAEFGGGCG